MPNFPGSESKSHLADLRRRWVQGDHVVITGPTGGGKTALARYVAEQRANRRGGTHMVFVMKFKPDATIKKEYTGYTRWSKWKKNPTTFDKRVLLWPEVEKYPSIKDKLKLQRDVFAEACDRLSDSEGWTVQNDEGFYFTHPQYLNLAGPWAVLQAMGRSANTTLMTLAQRPAHLPLLVYTSASHVYVGRSREATDVKRLSEIGGGLGSKALGEIISSQLAKHDFLYIPVVDDDKPRIVNLAK